MQTTPRTRTRKAAAATPAPPNGQRRGDAAMARAHTGDALATLVAIMTNGDAPATARVSAANAVLDRAWGKPRQDFEFSSAGDPVAAIQRARQRVHRQSQATGAEAASDEKASPQDG
ncbi:hypothetical protein [Novosphingobium sp. Fuku2-ISO-50]|uniref:hypothetical protein n=1 Tax=Novosphingobium sp. Fuku2-ISO-50 TaxID=1739114 RepID=UPI000A5E652F|nr:hypothetical protein [Novosphingobium sp. Fuku2-ISO-50]